MMGAGNANAVDRDVRGGLSVTCCLIHSVIPEEEALSGHVGMTFEERQKRWRQSNIFVGRSFPLLALQAYKAGILSSQAVSRIAHAAEKDIRRLCARHKAPMWTVRRNGGSRQTMLHEESESIREDIQTV